SASATGPRIIMLTTFDIDDYVFDAIRAGASGFLLKDAPPNELAEAVRVVASGDGLLAPSVTKRVIEHFAATPAASEASTPSTLPDLTDGVRELLVHVALGESTSEIAARLVIAVQTVQTHVSRILYNLDARDRAQAVIAAYESGLIVPGTQGWAILRPRDPLRLLLRRRDPYQGRGPNTAPQGDAQWAPAP